MKPSNILYIESKAEATLTSSGLQLARHSATAEALRDIAHTRDAPGHTMKEIKI